MTTATGCLLRSNGSWTIKTAILVLVLVIQQACSADITTNQVILVSGDWIPSTQQTQKAMAAIQSFLDKPGVTNRWSLDQIENIRKKTKDYRVQFIGKIRDGKKVIWCNFFPASRAGEKDEFPYWKLQVITVMDGGFWFWQIDYHPDTDNCSDFSSNGYA